MTLHAARLLIWPARAQATITGLQVTASAVTTLITYAVAMLSAALWRVDTDEVGYRVLAFALAGLLAVPLVTLGTATARLSARSRDDRLAALRLLGLRASRVRLVATAHVTVVAALGVAAGMALSAGLPFALGLLRLHGEQLTPGALWLPGWLAAAIGPALVVVAALSAMLGLRRVVLSPLGVLTRNEAPRLSWLRCVVAAFVIGGAVVVAQAASPGWGVAVVFGALTLALLAVMGVLGLAGPYAIAGMARRKAARTADPAALVAARGVQDDPRGAWRGVSALALAAFIVVPTGSLLGYLDMISHSGSRAMMTPEQLLLFGDARTIVLALVAVSFIVVACQAALTQAAAILEHRDLHVALDRIGMPRSAQNRARRLRVTGPTVTAVIGSAAAAAAITLPLVGVGTVTAPLFAAGIAIVLALGLALIWASVAATGPLLTRVLVAPARGE